MTLQSHDKLELRQNPHPPQNQLHLVDWIAQASAICVHETVCAFLTNCEENKYNNPTWHLLLSSVVSEQFQLHGNFWLLDLNQEMSNPISNCSSQYFFSPSFIIIGVGMQRLYESKVKVSQSSKRNTESHPPVGRVA